MQTELTQSFQLWMVIWCKEAGQRQHMLSFTGKDTNTVVSWEKIIVCVFICHLVTKNPLHCCQSGEKHPLHLHLAPCHQNPPRDEEMNYEFVLLHPPSSIIEFVPYKFVI
jgi:hypothetical protein